MAEDFYEEYRYDVSAENLKKLAEKLILTLRIRSIPLGMKLFENADDMLKIEGLRTPTAEFHFTTCQLVGQVRSAGFTLGIVHENTRMHSNCGGIVGLNKPSESYLSGENMNGVWFENREASYRHQAQTTRVDPNYQGL